MSNNNKDSKIRQSKPEHSAKSYKRKEDHTCTANQRQAASDSKREQSWPKHLPPAKALALAELEAAVLASRIVTVKRL